MSYGSHADVAGLSGYDSCNDLSLYYCLLKTRLSWFYLQAYYSLRYDISIPLGIPPIWSVYNNVHLLHLLLRSRCLGPLYSASTAVREVSHRAGYDIANYSRWLQEIDSRLRLRFSASRATISRRFAGVGMSPERVRGELGKADV